MNSYVELLDEPNSPSRRRRRKEESEEFFEVCPTMVDMDSLLDHPVISQRYFFPRQGGPAEYRDFRTPDGVRLRCFEHRPHPNRKTLVHYHGNGEIVTDYLPEYVAEMEQIGLNILLVEYRGYGGSTGRPELGKMLDDVRVVREASGLNPEETIVYGRSVGAIFAVEWVSGAPGVAGLILESGVADPLQRLLVRLEPEELGVDLEALESVVSERLNHREKLARFRGKLLILHAQEDSLVEVEHARLHHEWAPAEEKKLVLFPRGDHNTVLSANWETYLGELEAFVRRL